MAVAASKAAEDFSLSDAAEIIKTIDTAFDEASSSAITAASEAEEARKNARAASELARKFMAAGTTSSQYVPSTNYSYGRGLSSPPRTTTWHSNRRSPSSRSNPRINGSGGLSHNNNMRKVVEAKTEEIVALSLELDRMKLSLETEQMAHDETKSALAQAKAKNTILEQQIDRLLAEMETQRERGGRKVDALEREVAHARMRVEAAEEDAEVALDLAKESYQSREQLEKVLQQALEQNEQLRDQLASGSPSVLSSQESLVAKPPPLAPPESVQPSGDSTADVRRSPKIVRFADEPTVLSIDTLQHNEAPSTDGAVVPPPPPLDAMPGKDKPPRSLVSSGRDLLQRSLGSSSTTSPKEGETSALMERVFESAADRRQRLKDRLKSLTVDVGLPTPSSVSSSGSASPPRSFYSESGITGASEEACRNAANLIKKSGRRLNLSGRWWSEGAGQAPLSSTHLETLTRHYCTSVEVREKWNECLGAKWVDGTSSS